MKKAVSKKNLKTKKWTAKKVNVKAAENLVKPFVDPGGSLRDRFMDVEARTPKGPVSAVMSELMLDPDSVLIVKAAKGTVTNRDEFVADMRKFGMRVVFLEYGTSEMAVVPTIEVHKK